MHWYAYAQLEPFGEERADLRAGIITSSIVNMLIRVNTTSRSPRLTKPTDYMPRFGENEKRPPPKPATKEEFRARFDAFKEMVKATAGA